MRVVSTLVIASALLSIWNSANAANIPERKEAKTRAIELGAPFSDYAVLQRGMKVPVWGWSKPGTKVTVAFSGQKKIAEAGELGKWMVWLDPLNASFEPGEMTVVEDGGRKVTLKNILVGEVWLASGQSNMQYKVVNKGATSSADLKTAPRNGIAPIREFEVTDCVAQLHPIEKANGEWKHGNYSDYSAIAYAFAHKLYTELDVPIGILNCSWSQTKIQAWIPRQGLATGKDAYTKELHHRAAQTDPGTPEFKAAWAAFYQSLEDQMKANAERVKAGKKARAVGAPLPGNLNGNRDSCWLFNGRLNPVVPFAIRGAIWNQGYANSLEGLPYYHNLHSLIRGWRMVWGRPQLPVYFHQFYSPGRDTYDWKPRIGGTTDMRLGTWLARDIPNTGMASQIDIQGAVHYTNKALPGQRLALHALKNQYPCTKLKATQLSVGKAGKLARDLIVDGPMYKFHRVEGNKVIVAFDHAEGGLVVADSSHRQGRIVSPKIVKNGADKVTLFSLAGTDRVWHPATCTIEGSTVIVTSDAVQEPRGIAYGTRGIGFRPGLYNKASLPMTPFIYYDNKMVHAGNWPGGRLKVAGEIIDPDSVGKVWDWRKTPILPPQFRENAVLQAGTPITFWGSTQKYGEHGGFPKGKAVIHFQFGDIKTTIPVKKGMDEWDYTVPAMEATATPRTLTVSMTIDGKQMHERVCPGIVIGDVIYVASPSKPKRGKGEKSPQRNPLVRMMINETRGRVLSETPSPYSVAKSTSPTSRFASRWQLAVGLAADIGNGIAAKTGKPVGVVFMNASLREGNVPLKAWMAPECLNQAPSLIADYKTIGSQYPGNPFYDAKVRRYINDWKTYWNSYIATMIREKAVPNGEAWGQLPSMVPDGKSLATQAFNVSTRCFCPGAFAAVVFLTTDGAVKDADGANFGSEMSALANSFKGSFGKTDIPFIYGMPSKTLAASISKPSAIDGESHAVEMTGWKDYDPIVRKVIDVVTSRNR